MADSGEIEDGQKAENGKTELSLLHFSVSRIFITCIRYLSTIFQNNCNGDKKNAITTQIRELILFILKKNGFILPVC